MFARYIKQPLYQHLLFFTATILSISFMGYYFGTFDQIIHIPFLKKFADSSLFPGDSFLDLRLIHYSYFWFFLIPLYRIGVLEVSMFYIYICIIYLTFWAIWRVSITLFNNSLAAFWTVITFIFLNISFAGFSIIEFSLLNRVFVFPFLLLSIDFYLKKKYIPAFFILGIMFNLHALSANFVLFMFIFDTIIRFKKIGLRIIFFEVFIFIASAFPVLLWKFKNTRGCTPYTKNIVHDNKLKI